MDLPVVVEEPSGDEVVVVGVEEVVAAPCLVCEAVCEIGVLQDLRSVRYCSARQAWQTSINPVAGRAVKVPPDEVHGAEEFPYVGAVHATELLVGPYTSHPRVLKGGQKPFAKLFWQPDIVVQQQRDLRLDLWDRPAQLSALVGLAHR